MTFDSNGQTAAQREQEWDDELRRRALERVDRYGDGLYVVPPTIPAGVTAPEYRRSRQRKRGIRARVRARIGARQ